MKYMSVWSIAPENIGAVIKRFKENDPKPAEGVKLLGRWHEMATGKGFALMEADDPIALSKFVVAWSDLIDQKIVPVIEDEEVVQAL